MSGRWEVLPVDGGGAAWPATVAAALASLRPAMVLALCTRPAGRNPFERRLYVCAEPVRPRLRMGNALGRRTRPPLGRHRSVLLLAADPDRVLAEIAAGRLEVGEMEFPVDWCLRTWPGRRALVGSLPVEGATRVEERVEVLRACWADAGVDFAVPPAQGGLAKLMVPGPADPPPAVEPTPSAGGAAPVDPPTEEAPPRPSGLRTCLSVSVEGDDRQWALAVAAPAGAGCGEVRDALAAYLGAGAGDARELRRSDGSRLDPWGVWQAAGVRPGEHLVLASGPSPGSPAPPTPPGPAPVRPMETVTRGPRTHVPPGVHRAGIPPVPDETTLRGSGYQWQIFAGLALGGTAVIAGMVLPGMRWLALAGAMASVLGVLAAVMADRSRRAFQRRRFLEHLGALDQELAGVRRSQAAALHDLHPDPAAVATWIRDRGERLWERRQGDRDVLDLRLGTGRRASLIDGSDASRKGHGPLADELAATLARHAWLDGAPVVLPGRSAVTGIAGGGDGDGLARSLVLQAAALHAPADVAIAVVAGSPSWGWARWLPHAADSPGALVSWDSAGADALAVLLARRIRGRAGPGKRHLVVIEAGVAQRPAVLGLVAAVRTAPEAGWTVAVCAPDRRGLPSESSAAVILDSDAGRLTGAGAEAGPIVFQPEPVDVRQAEALARSLAPLREAGAPAPANRNPGLLELGGLGPPGELDVERRWAGGGGEPLEVPIGVSDTGEAVSLALRRDGPHGLIAGTTGAGKSELLVSILAGLAATHRPDTLSFLLVDYKGGAAFADLAALPHTVGLVTDLDDALAARALVSLNAELRRRETVLRRAGAAGIVELERNPAADGRLANLLIVVDEFATLAQELPGFVDALIDVAQRGRSLGVHLLLATQSPGGVVGPKLQANINYWICLRVSLDAESTAMIGTNDAALIQPNAPGRAYLKVGGQRTAFQTARIARPVATSTTGVSVEPFAADRPPGSRSTAGSSAQGEENPVETELKVTVRRIAAEAARLGVARPPSPWLPALPAVLPRGCLPGPGPVAGEHLIALVGLADEPDRQRQSPCVLDLTADGSCLVLGAFGAGKTTLLRQVGLDVASRYGAGDVHIYALDAGDGSLAPLAGLPHCADVVGADDADRTARLLDRLARLAEERRGVVLARPRIVLLVDDYPSIAGPLDYRHDSPAERLASLLRRGPAVGIHVVVASPQRSDLTSATFGLFGRKVLLRQADRTDYDLVGVPRGLQPAEPPPGRGFVGTAPPREIQVAWPAAEDGTFPPADLVALIAAEAHLLDPAACPRPIPAFPTEVRAADLPAPRPGSVVVGAGGPELEALAVDLDRDGPHLLFAGGDRTGRSTALAACLASMRSTVPRAPVVILAPRPSPLRGTVGAAVAFDPDGVDQALSDLAPGTLLVVDDAGALPPGCGDALHDALRSARDRGLHALVAGRTADLLRCYDDWARYLRSLRCGVLLNPEDPDGELFDVRLPPRPLPRVPGRGYLIRGRDLQPVQVALPPPAHVIDLRRRLGQKRAIAPVLAQS